MEKELKRLNRAELLELLLEQTKEVERLQKALDEAQTKLAERDLKIRNAGNLAQAVLEINGVMTAAQEAAQQYLENIARMESQTKLECERMLASAQEEAAKIQEKAHQMSVSDDDLLKDIHRLLEKK